MVKSASSDGVVKVNNNIIEKVEFKRPESCKTLLIVNYEKKFAMLLI